MEYLSIADIQLGLRSKQFSALELAEYHLRRIAKRDATLGAYLSVSPDDAREEARAVDAALAAGEELLPLAGVPLAVKDTILIAGKPCTAASKVLEPYTAAYDAAAVRKLRMQRAVFLGKTNCDEFAMGSSTENSGLRSTVNPWDVARVPGGSSGGSAVAVAADCATAALGSDTGGSVRQPAALSGVVGLKPTYGHVSRHGLIAMASSFDCIGPLARSVSDVRVLFHAIKGRDPNDATSTNGPRIEHRKSDIEHIRIGLPKEYWGAGMDPDVQETVRAAVEKLEELGATVSEVSLPHAEYALAVYYVLQPSEVSANLERYDGIRYGLSAAASGQLHAANLTEIYTRTRAAGFGPEVKRRIIIGTYALSAGYADRYYKRALAVRNRVRQDYERAFQEVDVIVSPTSPVPAWPLGEKANDPLSMYLADIFTVSANVSGLPALSLPCGFVGRDGKRLPVGLQLMGKWFDEEALFTVGDAYERACSWRAEHPEVA